MAPMEFTKLMKVPISFLGIRLVVNLDDIILMNQSEQLRQSEAQITLKLLEQLGFLVNKLIQF